MLIPQGVIELCVSQFNLAAISQRLPGQMQRQIKQVGGLALLSNSLRTRSGAVFFVSRPVERFHRPWTSVDRREYVLASWHRLS